MAAEAYLKFVSCPPGESEEDQTGEQATNTLIFCCFVFAKIHYPRHMGPQLCHVVKLLVRLLDFVDTFCGIFFLLKYTG